MNKALKSILSVAVALTLVGCAYTPTASSQAPSGPPDRVLDHFRTPDNGNSDIYLFCRNGDFYVYMNGYKSGSIEIHTEMNGRCNN